MVFFVEDVLLEFGNVHEEFGEVGLNVVQNGLLIGDRESVEFREVGASFDETIGETRSSQSGKIFDDSREASGELFVVVLLRYFWLVFTGNSVFVNSSHRDDCVLGHGNKATSEFEESLAEVLACLGVVFSFVGDACVFNSGHNWFSVGPNVAHQ